MDPRDDTKRVAVDVLVLGTPNLLTTFINNCIQMRVSVCLFSTRGVSEEVAKNGKVDFVVVDSGRRLYRGGGDGGRVVERWGWALNNVFGQQGVCW